MRFIAISMESPHKLFLAYGPILFDFHIDGYEFFTCHLRQVPGWPKQLIGWDIN